MDIEKLQDFFFGCMLVNSGIYAFTAIAVLVLRISWVLNKAQELLR